MITRSGIEVAMDAEAERPVVHVFRGSKTTAHHGRAVVDNQCRGAAKVDRSGSEVGALQLGVQHVDDPCRSPW